MSTKYGESEKTKSNLKISRKTNRKTISKIVNVKITEIKPTLSSKKHTINSDNTSICNDVDTNNMSNKEIVKNIKRKSIKIPKAISVSKEDIIESPKQTATSVSTTLEKEKTEISKKENKRNIRLNIPANNTQKNTYVKPDTSINQNSSFFYTPSVFERFKINITSIDDETEIDTNSDVDNVLPNTIETNTDDSNIETTDNENSADNNEINNSQIDNSIDNTNYQFDSTGDTADYENNYDNEEDEIITSENVTEIQIANEPVNFESTNNQPKNVFINATQNDPKKENEDNADDSYFAKVKKGIISNISSVFKKFSYEQNELIDIDKLNNLDLENDISSNLDNTTFSDISLNNSDIVSTNNAKIEFNNNIESLNINTTDSIIPVANSNDISIDMNSFDYEESSSNNLSVSSLSPAKTDQNIDKSPVLNQKNDSTQEPEIDFNITSNNDDESKTSDNFSDSDLDTDNMFSLDNSEYDNYQDIDYSEININYEDDTDDSNDDDFSIEDYFGVSDLEPQKEKKSNKKVKLLQNNNSNNADLQTDENIKAVESKGDTSSKELENILSDKFLKDNNIDEDMKNELLTELLNDEEIVNSNSNNSNTSTDNIETVQVDENDEFFTIIDTLAKTITKLENSAEIKSPIKQDNSDGKSINILINKDDIFSISILNETYEIVADFDGISVLSENINISTPKKNFYVTVGEKYIEIHNTGSQFTVNTNFEDIEFANAINNVTFAKKNNIIELNVKDAFKLSSINNKVELSMLNTSVADMKSSNVEISETINESSVCDNRTLLISEETQKVYLPYTIDELMHKLNNSDEYQTLEDVIENEYTVPLSAFKMPIVSRFKEAYKFMRTKEHSSVYAALDLAFELMFNSNLNPAVIRASKDLKELNVYLDCLYENEIDKFDCFKIVYKVLPKIK